MNKTYPNRKPAEGRWTEYPCDNGTVDVCRDGEIEYCNLPPDAAKEFVAKLNAHDELVAALLDIAGYSREFGDIIEEKIRAALAKVKVGNA